MSLAAVKGKVSIRDFNFDTISDFVNPLYKEYKDFILKAYDHHYSKCLSYNCDTGEVRNKNGWLKRLCNPSEVGTYYNMNDILKYEFMPDINNTISRLIRGEDLGSK